MTDTQSKSKNFDTQVNQWDYRKKTWTTYIMAITFEMNTQIKETTKEKRKEKEMKKGKKGRERKKRKKWRKEKRMGKNKD